MTVYIGTNRNDKLTGLDDVSDDFTGGLGNDLLIGGGGKGFDWAHYDSAPSAVTVNLATGVVSGGDGNDRLNGIEGVTGSAYNDSLTGRSDTYSVRIARVVYRSKKKFLNFSYGVKLPIPA